MSPTQPAWTRVIVTFQVASSATEDQKRAAIERGRSALLGELPKASYRVVRSYESLPAVALEISGEGLRILRSSARVAGIEQDALSAPQ